MIKLYMTLAYVGNLLNFYNKDLFTSVEIL